MGASQNEPSETKAPFHLTAVDKEVLSTKDEDFVYHSWEELKHVIAQNELDRLRRQPSELRRYIQWSSDTKNAYGTIFNYICQQRLHWTPKVSNDPRAGLQFEYKNPVPFVDEEDYKILPNDWPYGLEDGITHIVVWLKNRVPTEPVRGDMTPEGRKMVGDFVRKKFQDRVKNLPGSEEKVMWFKNWTALQSVPGLEHVHVLVREVPEDIIMEWTGGEKKVQG